MHDGDKLVRRKAFLKLQYTIILINILLSAYRVEMAALLTWVPFFAAFLSYSDRFSFRLKKNKYKNKLRSFLDVYNLLHLQPVTAAQVVQLSKEGLPCLEAQYQECGGKTRRYAVIRDSTAARLASAPLGEEYEEHITSRAKLSETDPMRVAPHPFTGTLSSTDHDI